MYHRLPAPKMVVGLMIEKFCLFSLSVSHFRSSLTLGWGSEILLLSFPPHAPLLLVSSHPHRLFDALRHMIWN